jgi:hypothetical protein
MLKDCVARLFMLMVTKTYTFYLKTLVSRNEYIEKKPDETSQNKF